MSEPRSPDRDGAAGLLALLHRSEPLKHLPRTGWVDRDVADPESVAAHSWRLALLAWLSAEAQGIDAGRSMILALVHDLAEAITGDLTPFHDGVRDVGERRALAIDPPAHEEWRTPARRAEKLLREREAMGAILHGIPEATASLVRGAWEEYEEGSSAAARLVRQLDRLEAYVQGREYAANGRLADTGEPQLVPAGLRAVDPRSAAARDAFGPGGMGRRRSGGWKRRRYTAAPTGTGGGAISVISFTVLHFG